MFINDKFVFLGKKYVEDYDVMYTDVEKYDKGQGIVPYYFIINYSGLRVIYGYCYAHQNYGIQVRLNMFDLSVRFLTGTSYSSWQVISSSS